MSQILHKRCIVCDETFTTTKAQTAKRYCSPVCRSTGLTAYAKRSYAETIIQISTIASYAKRKKLLTEALSRAEELLDCISEELVGASFAVKTTTLENPELRDRVCHAQKQMALLAELLAFAVERIPKVA